LYHIHQLNVDSFALIWNEFVSELRFHFESRTKLPNTIENAFDDEKNDVDDDHSIFIRPTNINSAVCRLASCIVALLALSNASTTDESSERWLINGERLLHSLETIPIADAAKQVFTAAMSNAVGVLTHSMSAAQSAMQTAHLTQREQSALSLVCHRWHGRIADHLESLSRAMSIRDVMAEWTSIRRGVEFAETECATFCCVAYRMSLTPVVATSLLDALLQDQRGKSEPTDHVECAVDSLSERRTLLGTVVNAIDNEIIMFATGDDLIYRQHDQESALASMSNRRLFVRSALSADGSSCVMTRSSVL